MACFTDVGTISGHVFTWEMGVLLLKWVRFLFTSYRRGLRSNALAQIKRSLVSLSTMGVLCSRYQSLTVTILL